jgi:hypothetical protein
LRAKLLHYETTLATLLENKVQVGTEAQITVENNTKKLRLDNLFDAKNWYNIVNITSSVWSTKYNFFGFSNVNNHFVIQGPQLNCFELLIHINISVLGD